MKSLIEWNYCHSIVLLKTIPRNQIEFKSFYFRCNCGKKFSCSFNSIFYQNKILISQYDLIIYAFLKKFTAEQTSDILQLGIRTIKVYFQLFRRVVSEIMLTMIMNIKLNGIIELDEAVITGKRKYHRGRLTRKIYWVFGLISRETKKGYAFLVPNRRSETLFPIIQKYFLNRTIIFLLNLNSVVEAKSTIMSDQFSVYVTNHGSSRIVAEFPDLELQHYWVNHKKYFCQPYFSRHSYKFNRRFLDSNEEIY